MEDNAEYVRKYDLKCHGKSLSFSSLLSTVCYTHLSFNLSVKIKNFIDGVSITLGIKLYY
jgi:hypothetical protein